MMKIIRLFLFILFTSAAFADVNSAMSNFYNNITATTNAATLVQTQSANIMSAGGFSTRTQSVTYQPFSFTPPSFNATCGNIDFYGGAFSYLNNTSQLMSFLQNALITAAPLIFINALKSISPNLAGSIMSFFDSAQKLLNLASNSCQLGSYLGMMGGSYAGQALGNLTSMSFAGSQDALSAVTNNTVTGNTGSKNITDEINSWSSTLSTWANKLNGALNPSPSSFTSGNNDYSAAGQTIAQTYGSIIWKGMQQLGNVYCTSCTSDYSSLADLTNLMISLVGDVIIAPSKGDPLGITPVVVPPTIQDVRNFYEGLPTIRAESTSGSGTKVYNCSGFSFTSPRECFDITLGTQGVASMPTTILNHGFKEQVTAMMNDLQDHFVKNTQLSPASLELIALSPVPIYQMAQAMQDAGMTSQIASQLNIYAEYIAYTLTQSFISQALRLAEISLGTKNVQSNDQAKTAVQTLLHRIQSLNEALIADSYKYAKQDPAAMLQQINYIRSYAISQYSPSILQKIQFAKAFNNH